MTRIPGHALTIEFSGERRREERSSTGYCRCGWEESASTQAEVRREYHWHLVRVARQMQNKVLTD
jgi:hypothetical protein